MSASWHGGKGSTPRTRKVDSSTFENNWDKIFSRGQQQQPPEKYDPAIKKEQAQDRRNG